MKISTFFDGGRAPYSVKGEDGDNLSIKLVSNHFDIMIYDAPKRLSVHIMMYENFEYHIVNQGLIVSYDDVTFTAVPFVKNEKYGGLSAVLEDVPKRVRLSSLYPYGRDSLDQLLCDTRNVPHLNVRYMRSGGRALPIFQFGPDDAVTHYIIAGEDNAETPGIYAADGMIRFLCEDTAYTRDVLKHNAFRIIPLASPYSSALAKDNSYTMPEDGMGSYAASSWGNGDATPPEFAVYRNEVDELIQKKQLGICMTVHSWTAGQRFTMIEAIRSSGDHTLSPARAEKTEKAIQALLSGLPVETFVKFVDTCWVLGLSRDYLRNRHNFTSFMTEITSYEKGTDSFRETGRQYIKNICAMRDFGFLYKD